MTAEDSGVPSCVSLLPQEGPPSPPHARTVAVVKWLLSPCCSSLANLAIIPPPEWWSLNTVEIYSPLCSEILNNSLCHRGEKSKFKWEYYDLRVLVLCWEAAFHSYPGFLFVYLFSFVWFFFINSFFSNEILEAELLPIKQVGDSTAPTAGLLFCGSLNVLRRRA